MLKNDKRKLIQSSRGRRETLDRRKCEIMGIVLAVLRGQFISKRCRERRTGFDRRARAAPAY